MKKTFLFAAVAALAIVSCNKKTETVTTEPTTEVVDSVAQTEVEPSAPGDLITEKYVSNDGKTTLSVVFDAVNGTAILTNETTGDVLNFKQEVSASGSVYKDEQGNVLTVHQDKFYLEKNGKTVSEGSLVKEEK